MVYNNYMKTNKTVTDNTITITLEDGSYVRIDTSDMMDEGEWVIENVEAITKKQGYGTLLMEEAIKEWRQNGENMTLTLFANPQDDSIEYDALVAWYEDLGFEVDEEAGGDTGDGVFMRY